VAGVWSSVRPVRGVFRKSLQIDNGSDGTRTRDLRRDRPARRNRLHNRLQPGITGYSRHLIAERTATPDFRRLHPAGPV
jgi:hypothetical protein